MPGEAVPKHVAVLSITGRDFKVETIRLKTVRPFVMKEIVLSEDRTAKTFAKKDNRTLLTRYLMDVVESLIEQATREWLEVQDEEDDDEELEVPLPLIRLRVEYSAPDGGKFDCENPQRFSNRFVGKVANVNDVVQFYRKKAGTTRKARDDAELPEESILAQMTIDSVKVEKLVREFLTAQSLTIFPQNSFGDAVSQFVDKDDKHAMEMFVNENLIEQVKHLMDIDDVDDDIQNAMDQHRSKLEELFAAGRLKKSKRAKLKPRPENWDSDLNEEWEAQPAAWVRSDNELDQDDEGASPPKTKPTAKGRPRATAPKKTPAATKKAVSAKTSRGRKVIEEESEEQDDDAVMIDSDEESQLFVQPAPRKPATKKPPPPKKTAPAAKRTSARNTTGTATRQTQIAFSQPATQSRGKGMISQQISGDEISDDDDDAFEPAPSTFTSNTSNRGRR